MTTHRVDRGSQETLNAWWRAEPGEGQGWQPDCPRQGWQPDCPRQAGGGEPVTWRKFTYLTTWIEEASSRFV